MKVQINFSDPLSVMPSDKLKIDIGFASIISEKNVKTEI